VDTAERYVRQKLGLRQYSLHLYIFDTKKLIRPSPVPASKILLLAPNSPGGHHAQRLLQDKGLQFLVVRPDNVLKEDDEENEPVLLAEGKRYTGIHDIQSFIQNYAENVDAEKIGRTLRVLRELEIKSDMRLFSTRLRIQKILYLLQELGLQTGWKFSWYVRGPYSPDLAHELFEHQQKGTRDSRVQDDERKALERFREKFGASPLSAQQLEAAAAVVFVAKSSRLRSAGLVVAVSKEKPYLPKPLIEEYVKKLYP